MAPEEIERVRLALAALFTAAMIMSNQYSADPKGAMKLADDLLAQVKL